jgi:hypothetical protein
VALDQQESPAADAAVGLDSNHLDLDSVISVRPDLTCLPYGELTVVVGSRAVTLNRSAMAILQALDGVRPLRAVAEQIAAEHQVEADGLREVMVPIGVAFARAKLVNGVTYVDPPSPNTGPSTAVQQLAEPDRDVRPGAPEPTSCSGKLLQIGTAEFIDVHGPGGALSISCNDHEAAVAVAEFFAPLAGDAARHGLAVVVGQRGPKRGPLMEIFDATGYRIWRGRTIETLLDALAALLVPFVPDPDVHRAIFDFRRLVRDGRAVLVDPRLIEDIKAQRVIERMGWAIPPAVFSEVDLDTCEVVVREPLNPLAPASNRVTERFPIVGFGMHLQLEAGHGIGPIVEGLCNAQLPTRVTATLVESLPAVQRLAASSVARWPLMPGTAQQIPFLTELLADVDRPEHLLNSAADQ